MDVILQEMIDDTVETLLGLDGSTEGLESTLHDLAVAAKLACLEAMIARPEKAASYEEALAVIRKNVPRSLYFTKGGETA